MARKKKDIVKKLVIDGITFRLSRVKWEDAWGRTRGPIPLLEQFRKKRGYHQLSEVTVGYTARVGDHLIMIHGYEDGDPTRDASITVVPLRAKVQITRL